MSTNKKNNNDLEVKVEEVKYQTTNIIEKNQKLIVTAIVGIALVIGGFFAYKYLIQAPKEREASAAIFYAEKYFGVDSFQLALDGDGINPGFLKICSDYSGTKIGNTAHYYAALCYLYLGNPQEALNYLDKFDGKGTEFAQTKLGLTASAHYELGDASKALEYYQKAISFGNTIYTAQYLRAASILLSKNGNLEEAIKYEKRIKSEFTSSIEFRDADRYLAQYGSLD